METSQWGFEAERLVDLTLSVGRFYFNSWKVERERVLYASWKLFGKDRGDIRLQQIFKN